MEAAFISLWFSVNYIKISLFFLAAAETLGGMLGLKEYRTLVLTFATVLVPLSGLLFDSYRELAAFVRPGLLAPYALTAEPGIPLFLLVAGIIANRKRVS